jgi:heme-degrading monooxygenase HmoA
MDLGNLLHGREGRMIRSTLTRKTTVTDSADFEKRQAALETRLLPLLQKQPGFVSHEMRRDGDAGGMVQVTAWQTEADCRAYLRQGGAATAATILDAFFPTAPYPDGNWVRENVEA